MESGGVSQIVYGLWRTVQGVGLRREGSRLRVEGGADLADAHGALEVDAPISPPLLRQEPQDRLVVLLQQV